jgi:membrane glycosyltransferase
MDGELTTSARVIPLGEARAGPSGGMAAPRPGNQGMPPEAPLAMPTQVLRSAPAPQFRQRFDWRVALARSVAIAGTLAIIVYGVNEMLAIIRIANPTVLQDVMVGFFAVTLAWIAQAAASAIAGLIPRRHLPLASPEQPLARTALVMPIYNEDAQRTTAALRAMAESLQQCGAARSFELVLLSDSTQSDAWIRETQAVRRLREAAAPIMQVWYRRRWHNTGRKAGNIQDFVERWGARYEYMVILDADSLIEGATLVWMVRAMMADETLGLLQTVPQLIGGTSLFARMQQFAGRVYGRVISRGLAAWAGDDGNYWGHNAILRMAAFAGCCGLPQLPGRKPFGGHILSHDFVEAALMRRAGWKVRMADEVGGSYEESPPSLVDVAIRDRRWAQGNLQHVKVLGADGLSWHSRMHFAFGIMSYLSSPLWLLLLLIGLALAVQGVVREPVYFRTAFQLFPSWPRFDAQRMLALFAFSTCVLFTPKFLGFVGTLFRRRSRRPVGVIGLTVSTVFEVLLSALFAPVQMLMQSRYVAEILLGRDAGWTSQRRSAGRVPWREAWRLHWGHTLAGALLGTTFWLLSPPLFWWLSPALLGMAIAAPLSVLSGSTRVGGALARIRVLATPEELRIPEIVRRRDSLCEQGDAASTGDPLRSLARDESARWWHAELNPAPPGSPRGQPDPDRLMARQKIQDARSLDEALGFLTARERLQVAADPQLLQRLASLPE